MLLNHKGERATKERYGICPDCGGELIPKCGEIKIHHWAHKTVSPNCNYKPMTDWHYEWQQSFLMAEDLGARIEVREFEKNIADVRLADGRVVEMQHSDLTPEKVRERELAYGPNMIWLIDSPVIIKKKPFSENYWLMEFKRKQAWRDQIKCQIVVDDPDSESIYKIISYEYWGHYKVEWLERTPEAVVSPLRVIEKPKPRYTPPVQVWKLPAPVWNFERVDDTPPPPPAPVIIETVIVTPEIILGEWNKSHDIRAIKRKFRECEIGLVERTLAEFRNLW